MPEIAELLSIGVGALGLIAAYLTSRRAKALTSAVLDFAEVARVYYTMRQDGWTPTEKQALAEASIGFFHAVEAAGVEIARPA